MPKSEPASSVEEAEEIASKLGYPVVVRLRIPSEGLEAVWFTIWKNFG